MLSNVTAERSARLVLGHHDHAAHPRWRPRPSVYVLRPLAPGDLGWVVRRHGILYADEHRYDEGFEALVARIMATTWSIATPTEKTPGIAEVDGEPWVPSSA